MVRFDEPEMILKYYYSVPGSSIDCTCQSTIQKPSASPSLFLLLTRSSKSLYFPTMVRGSSQSQVSSSSNSRPSITAPRGSAAATAGMRRRRIGTGSSSGGGSVGAGGGTGSNMLRFYTDDAPGLKITPTAVLVASLCFIGFVTILHVFGKLYRKSPGGA